MPFTPFHFGPGLLAKGLAPRHLSFIAFAGAQVAVDLEPLYHIARHDSWFHGWVHTVLVASAVGLAVGFLTSAIGRRFLGHGATTVGPAGPAPNPPLRSEAALGPALLGGFLGGASHPIFDATMHHDVHPFRPFTEANPLSGIVSLPAVVAFCLVAGAVGIVLILRSHSAVAK